MGIKHNQWGTTFYRYWSNLIYKFTNKKSKHYNPKIICKDWLDFNLFYLDTKDTYDYYCNYYETKELKLVAMDLDEKIDVNNYEWLPRNSKNSRYLADKALGLDSLFDLIKR